MSTITFDTFKFVDRLEKAGLSREQAAAIVEAQKDAFAEALDTAVATKSDIERIERKLLEHDGKFSVSEAKMDKLAWMMGVLIAIAAANFARQFFERGETQLQKAPDTISENGRIKKGIRNLLLNS